MNLSNWIQAIRPKTLPLSVSGILVGMSLAHYNLVLSDVERDYWLVFSFSISTTLLFQITSNLANDYADFMKGTDNKFRIGPERMVVSGKVTPRQMKTACILTSALSLISASILIFTVRDYLTIKAQWIYLGLACLSVIAAITYTVGKRAYGYRGFGDLMVFLFFGLLSVIGSFLLFGFEFDHIVLFFSISIGLWSTAVLNLNNMRDYENDKNHDKNTFVVKIGLKMAVVYHSLLILFGHVFWMLGLFEVFSKNNLYILMIAAIPPVALLLHLKRVVLLDFSNLKRLNPELGKVAMTVFLSTLTLFLILVFC